MHPVIQKANGANTYPASSKLRKAKTRKTLSVELSGPLRSMVVNEMKKHARPGSKSRGALKRVMELCVVAALGSKYPKLNDHYRILKEHGAA